MFLCQQKVVLVSLKHYSYILKMCVFKSLILTQFGGCYIPARYLHRLVSIGHQAIVLEFHAGAVHAHKTRP